MALLVMQSPEQLRRRAAQLFDLSATALQATQQATDIVRQLIFESGESLAKDLLQYSIKCEEVEKTLVNDLSIYIEISKYVMKLAHDCESDQLLASSISGL